MAGPQPREITDRGNYLLQYEAMAPWFRNRNWDWSSVVQGSLMVFGWMPTILEGRTRRELVITKERATMVAAKLNAGDEATIDKDFVNSSPVGTSKFLHFWRPDSFAIWDSNVCKALTGDKRQVRSLAAFDDYTNAIRMCAKQSGSTLREIEQRIFWVGQNAKSGNF